MPKAVRTAFIQPVGGGVIFLIEATTSILLLSCCICNDFFPMIVSL
jgi:hypothetical protein